MTFTQKVVCIIFMFLNYSLLLSQETTPIKEELSLEKSPIGGQFDYITKESSSWRDDNGKNYEVIKRKNIETLKAHTLDTLNALKLQIINSKNNIDRLNKEIKSLKDNLELTKTSINKLKEEKNSITLFGFLIDKTLLNTIFIVITTTLLTFCLFFAFKFKNSNSITKEAKLKLLEVENEFEEHRRNALEREQKVRRQLQDEINKNKK